MGTYTLPRNVKGEGRILFIFTGKSMIFTVIGGVIGLLLFYLPLSLMEMNMVGIIIMVSFALVGFIIGSLKMPNISKFQFTQKTGGENIDEVIKRAIKFKQKGRKLYIYKEEEKDAR